MKKRCIFVVQHREGRSLSNKGLFYFSPLTDNPVVFISGLLQPLRCCNLKG